MNPVYVVVEMVIFSCIGVLVTLISDLLPTYTVLAVPPRSTGWPRLTWSTRYDDRQAPYAIQIGNAKYGIPVL